MKSPVFRNAGHFDDIRLDLIAAAVCLFLLYFSFVAPGVGAELTLTSVV